MSIPCNITPLGIQNDLPAGYTPLEFLQSAGSQYIDTQTYNVFEYELDYLSTYSGGSNILAGYIQPGSVRAFGIVEKNKVAIASTGDYYREADVSAAVKNTVVYNANLGATVLINATRYSTAAYGGKVLRSTPMEAEVPVYLFACNAGELGAVSCTKSACLYGAKLKDRELTLLFDAKPVLDPTGTPCMFDAVTRQAFKNSGTEAFIAGVETVAQLTNLLRALPDTGGKLSLSLPAEANTPEVAATMQACHDTKGWTLTVYEYRPALPSRSNTAEAAATYSLRRVREVVWCRKEQTEHGSYVDAMGTLWQIDRCAAIFGPQGQDPMAYGYEPYDNVDQAAEQWGLTLEEPPVF